MSWFEICASTVILVGSSSVLCDILLRNRRRRKSKAPESVLLKHTSCCCNVAIKGINENRAVVGKNNNKTSTTTTIVKPASSGINTISSSSKCQNAHQALFSKFIFKGVSAKFQSLDPNRMTLLLFCLNGLDCASAGLGQKLIDNEKTALDDKNKVIKWIYACQSETGGFQGSPTAPLQGEASHLVMTYSAMVCLLILGDYKFSQLKRNALLQWMRTLQNPETGGFRSLSFSDSEEDARFLYCACAISFMLRDFSGMNVDLAKRYLKSLYNEFDGGFGLHPHAESHGGAVNVCVSAMCLLNCVGEILNEEQLNRLVHFCVMRQSGEDGGFNGRVNKDSDTCYAYWICSSLISLNRINLVNVSSLQAFLKSTENCEFGGFCKTPKEPVPDPLHSFTGMWANNIAFKGAVGHDLYSLLGLSKICANAFFDNN